MKYILFLFILGTAAFSCNSQSKRNPQESKDSPAVLKKRECCFKTKEDFAAFYPGETAGFTYLAGYDLVCKFNCSDYITEVPKAARTYVDRNGEKLALDIEDYSRIDTGWQKRATIEWSMKGNTPDNRGGEYRALEKKGVYSGYAKQIKQYQVVQLFVNVDDRFLINIVGVNNSSLEETLRLFELIPVDKLADFCK